MYKHYVELFENTNFISVGFSSGEQPRRKTNNALVVLEDDIKEFHLTTGGEIHPVLLSDGMSPMYRYENGAVIKLSDADVATLDRRGNEAYEASLKIRELMAKLAATDYIDNKIIEYGEEMRQHYADVIAQRAEWRSQINEQEAIVAARYTL